MKKRLSFLLACLLVVSVWLSIAVSADKEASALADAISLPAALIKGHSYSLPVQVDGEQLSLTVNGQSCGDGAFTAEGEQAVIAYATADGTEVATYTLSVIDTGNSADHCAYFYAPDGGITVQENENNIALSCSADAKTSFISKLNAASFGLNLAFPDSSNYKTLTVKLTDATDARNSLTVSIDPAAKKVSAGGQQVQLTDLGDPMQLTYKNLNRSLYNGDTLLLACEKNDSGDEFEGFANGVYLTVGFEGVTGDAQVYLTRIGNQSLGHKNSTDADLSEPVIALVSELNSTQYVGDTFDIPAYAVYDVFSSITESSVSVELPDGSTASEPFVISQYGRYKIVYTAKDACGNSAKVNKIVFVNDDIAPELSVNALEKTEYNLGDAVTFPTYTASDNLDACFVDVILVLPNCEVRLLTHDANGEVTYCLADQALYNASFRKDNSSFKTEQTGTYTLRYVAYDDQFNRAVQEITFSVK